MTLERATTLYLRNNVTVDTGTGIDIRILDDVNGGTNDITQTATATHTQDNVERTFDPATAGVTNTNNAGTTLFKTGWALRLTEDMTPVDDTNCNAFLPAGTLTVNLNVTLQNAGGTDLGGTQQPTWRASLWRYNPSTDTGTLIAAGSNNSTTWSTVAVTGDAGTFKTVPVSIVVSTATEFSPGEILLLQTGLNTGTLTNPTLGTITYTFTLRIDNNNSAIVWAAGQSIKQTCTLSDTTIGLGTTTRDGLQNAIARSGIGKGINTESRAVVASKTFTAIGTGIATQTSALALLYSLTGVGVGTESRAVIASKSFSLTGSGEITRVVNPIFSRTLIGIGATDFTKSIIAAKSFEIIGIGTSTESRTVQAQRTFSLTGNGETAKTLAIAEDFNLIGLGDIAFNKAVTASKSFTIIGTGIISREGLIIIAVERTATGKGLITEIHPVQAFRTFNVPGIGQILITGSNTSSITIPIDEVPDAEGGTTIIKRPVYIFDD